MGFVILRCHELLLLRGMASEPERKTLQPVVPVTAVGGRAIICTPMTYSNYAYQLADPAKTYPI